MEKDQVALSNLVFTHNWEDPESDHAALQIKNGESVLAITSGGCNVLGFLLFDPAIIYSIDINAAQSHILALKIAAIKSLTFEEFVCFSGLKNHEDRKSLYARVRAELNTDARQFWDGQEKVINGGFIMAGKYERFIRMAVKFLHLLQGRKRVVGLFAEKSEADQESYFDNIWDTRRFHSIFKLLFNKRMLARRGLVADYFHFDDGSSSFSESFYNRAKKAIRTIPIKGNYFLSLYFMGRYQNLAEVPAYLKPENFDLIKSRVNRIQVITADAQRWIASMIPHSIDCFALSNICELMSEKDTALLFDAVLNAARPGARVIFRNLMVPREVPQSIQQKIVKNEALTRKIFDNDRSFVYGKVAAYAIP